MTRQKPTPGTSRRAVLGGIAASPLLAASAAAQSPGFRQPPTRDPAGFMGTAREMLERAVRVRPEDHEDLVAGLRQQLRDAAGETPAPPAHPIEPVLELIEAHEARRSARRGFGGARRLWRRLRRALGLDRD